MRSALVEGQAALAALDVALAAMPSKDQVQFGVATEHLCAMREVLIAEHRNGADRIGQLEQLNSIISCNLSGHFPLGTVPWPLLLSARVSLQGLLAGVANQVEV